MFQGDGIPLNSWLERSSLSQKVSSLPLSWLTLRNTGIILGWVSAQLHFFCLMADSLEQPFSFNKYDTEISVTYCGPTPWKVWALRAWAGTLTSWLDSYFPGKSRRITESEPQEVEIRLAGDGHMSLPMSNHRAPLASSALCPGVHFSSGSTFRSGDLTSGRTSSWTVSVNLFLWSGHTVLFFCTPHFFP